MDHGTATGGDAPQAEHIRFLFDPPATLCALAGQRRRFGSTVATLTVDELAAPSRCEGWTVADVLRHLVWVDATMRRLWSGDESPAVRFDPRTTPNDSVNADRSVPDDEIQRRYLASTETMIVELESADPERFGHPSLSPAGLVPWWLSAVHQGWDSTVHERDALAPLGRAVEAVSDEMVPCLAYSLVLAALFDRRGHLDVQIGTSRLSRGGGPVIAWATAAGTGEHIANLDGSDDGVTVLSGDPAATIDALCGRGSITDTLKGDRSVIDRLNGLARYFTATG